VEVYAAPVGIKGEFPRAVTLLATCTPSEMEAVFDYEYLSGAHDKAVIKEVSVAAENVLETYRFLPPPYPMEAYGSAYSGLNWADVNIAYGALFQTINEATANFAHLYAKGSAKCKFLSNLLSRSVQNLDTFGCPSRKSFRTSTSCSLPRHRFSDKSCAARNAHSVYGWLMFHIKMP